MAVVMVVYQLHSESGCWSGGQKACQSDHGHLMSQWSQDHIESYVQCFQWSHCEAAEVDLEPQRSGMMHCLEF